MKTTSYPRGIAALPIVGILALVAVIAVLLISTNSKNTANETTSQDVGKKIMLQEDSNSAMIETDEKTEMNEPKEMLENNEGETMMKKEDGAMMPASPAGGEKNETPEQEAMEKKEGEAVMQKDGGTVMKSDSPRYVEYSKTVLEQSADERRVIYFYATWCPSCKTANEDFLTNSNKIPQDVVVIRTNYNDPNTDADEKDLAKKYRITYQHTFVQIDARGNEITKWNGGGVDKLVANIK